MASAHTSKRARLLVLGAGLVLLVGAALLRAWLVGAFLPNWVRWHEPSYSLDLTGSGQQETVRVVNRQLEIISGDKHVTLDPAWFVSDVLVGDIDEDGQTELLVLLWKRGRYGTSRPFWVKHDELGFSQHIFIYRWDGHNVQPVWMASKLPVDVASWELEGQVLTLTSTQGEKSHWAWISWGLKNIDE